MSCRQQEWFRVVAMAMAAASSLLMLFRALQGHFDGDSARFAKSQVVYANDAGKTSGLDAYKPTNEVKPKVISESKKTIYVGMQVENIYNLSLKDRVLWLTDGTG